MSFNTHNRQTPGPSHKNFYRFHLTVFLIDELDAEFVNKNDSSDEHVHKPGPSHKKMKCEEGGRTKWINAEFLDENDSSDDDTHKPGPSHKKRRMKNR